MVVSLILRPRTAGKEGNNYETTQIHAVCAVQFAGHPDIFPPLTGGAVPGPVHRRLDYHPSVQRLPFLAERPAVLHPALRPCAGPRQLDHFLNNMLLLLVVGPPMEEKYGSLPLLKGILLTASSRAFCSVRCSPARRCWARRASSSCSSCWHPCPASRAASPSPCCWWRRSIWPADL